MGSVMGLREVFVCALSFSAYGCAATVVDSSEEAAEVGEGATQALVTVERVSTPGAEHPLVTNISAKFMKFSSATDPDVAAQILGLSLELPAIGTCSVKPSAEEPAPADLGTTGSKGSIELLDVGDVSVRAGARRTSLAARAFPDVGDVVSGMFYTSHDVDSDLPGRSRYVFESTGTSGELKVEAEAPATLEGVQVGRADLAGSPHLSRGEAVVVRWEPGTFGDRIYIDLASSDGDRARCAFADNGEAAIPSDVVHAVLENEGLLTLGVHRVRETEFTSDHVDFGQIRFDLSIVGPIVLDSRAE
jgi:hypothetical protein